MSLKEIKTVYFLEFYQNRNYTSDKCQSAYVVVDGARNDLLSLKG